ncbi:Protein of unknown function [Pyronema omphalodes CBS 100304]|uniref:Uncharacterized protein n=1 Tax=Pyronema omphalodes (strain CBS 100304) TaxID=1076935 RepID=U4LPZ5_PYROM|nr:Protein of unknown function [Pyronema omphalodes CBS 100304]
MLVTHRLYRTLGLEYKG